MKTTTFVCTADVAKAHGKTPHAGLAMVTLPVDAGQCKTKFGRWLAERIGTTVRVDDLSRVTLASRHTEAQTLLKQGIDSLLSSHPCKTAEDHGILLDKLSQLIEEQHRIAKMAGSLHFRPVSAQFAWPVLGSHAADHITDPAAYFDYCAGLIRGMHPAAVKLWDGEQPPESLKVTP